MAVVLCIFSFLDKQRYLSEFRVQMLRIQNYDLFHVLHLYLLYGYWRMEDRLPRHIGVAISYLDSTLLALILLLLVIL